MAKDLVKSFYEKKYSIEESGISIELVNKTDFPTTRFEAALKFIPLHFTGGSILELGAGNGIVANALLNTNIEINSYTLGDLSLSRVFGLKRNLSDSRVKILEIDAEHISDEVSEKYDLIIMIALIEHLIDPLRAMQNIRKLLKPNGFVYLDTPNVAHYSRRAKLLLGKFPSTASKNEGLTTYNGKPVDLHDEGHLHYFTYRSLSLMLTERCGFSKITKLYYPCGSMPLGKHMHSHLAKIKPELFSEIAILAMA